MPNVVMPSVVMPSVVMPSVIMPSVVAPSFVLRHCNANPSEGVKIKVEVTPTVFQPHLALRKRIYNTLFSS
jgi:hypothetical protein